MAKTDVDELSVRASRLTTEDIRVNDGEKFTVSIGGQGPNEGPIVVECKARIEGRYCYIFVNDRRILVHGYPEDLEDVVNDKKNISDVPLPDGWKDERMCGSGEGDFYNYLFLDPRKLPRDTEMTFKTFVEAIFYVGKGTHNYEDKDKEKWYLKKQRSYKHFYRFEEETQVMIDYITAITESSEKIIVAHFFDCDSKDDHCTREACMIKAIGKERLVNEREGSVKDETLGDSAQIHLGVNCLYHAFTTLPSTYRYTYPLDPQPASRSRSVPATPEHVNPSPRSETDPNPRTHQSRQQSKATPKTNLYKTDFKNIQEVPNAEY